MTEASPLGRGARNGKIIAYLGCIAAMAAVWGPYRLQGQSTAPSPDAQPIPLPFPPPGVLVAKDGRYLSPLLRAYPPSRLPLDPQGRWTLPSDILAQIPEGHYLELRNTDVGNSAAFLKPLVAASMALPCWRLCVRMDASTPATGVLQIDILNGPRGTERGEIRWDGRPLRTVDTHADAWRRQRLRIELARSDSASGFHLLEVVDAGTSAFDAKQLPPAFFVTGLQLPLGARILPSSVQIKGRDQSDDLFLLPAMARGMPVRLWTLGYGNRSNLEFAHFNNRPDIGEPGPAKTLVDGYAAGLHHVDFHIDRNPDGSQVADFQQAISRIASLSEARLQDAVSLTIHFRSPAEGVATMVGEGKATGAWRIEANGAPFEEGIQAPGPFRIDGIPVRPGDNSIRISAEAGIVTWDWLGLDLSADKTLESDQPFAEFPLRPPSGHSKENAVITIDPQLGLRPSGESKIHEELFGITDHNGLLDMMGSPPFLDSVKAMNLGSIKGADGVVNTTAPHDPILKLADLDAYYASPHPRSQFESWYWNDHSLKVIEETRTLNATRILIGSGIPTWALLSQTDGWNSPPRDLDLAANLVCGGLRTIRPLWPEVHYLYAWNEPDTAWWKAKDRLGSLPGGYLGYFRAYLTHLSKAVKTAWPEMQIGGPTTAALPLSSTARERFNDEWSDWWEPVLRENWNDLDFLDFHFYGNDPREVLANLDVLAAAGQALHGGRKSVAVTESNFVDSVASSLDTIQSEPDCWRYRSLPYARYLITMAGQPDRIWANMAHDLMAGEYGFYLYGGFEPTSIVDVFQALAPLRGTLLSASCLDPDFTWTASRNGNRMVVAVVTGERNGGEVQVSLPKEYTGEATVRRLALNEDFCDVGMSESKPSIIEGRLTLPPMPGSLIVIAFDLPPLKPLTGYLDRTDHFANHFMAILDDRTPSVVWKVEGISPNLTNHYLLRISTSGASDPTAIAFSWNGAPIHVERPYVDEVELPSNAIRPANEIGAALKDPTQKSAFILGSVSLIEERRTSSAP